MKIAITSTVSWPYIRRGSRITYELAVYLAKQGHDVHYISIKPGNVSRKKMKDGVTVEYHSLIDNPLLTICKVWKLDTFSLSCLGSLLKHDYDIVQTTFPMDAIAASINKSIKGTPFVHYMFDRFYRRYYITKYGKFVFKRCVKTASRIATISNYINNDLKDKFGVEGVIIPGTVDDEQFTICKEKDISSPYILAASSLLETRKRIPLLIKAFELLLRHIPNASLKLSGHTNPIVNSILLDSVSLRTRKAVEILGVGRREDLPGLYRNAAVTVLPSINEAFGLIILESLASGTPVVGTRSGGIPDILTDPKTGILFEEADGPEELCKALLKGMELARDSDTWIRCRQHAEQYSWSNIGPLYEKLYADVLDSSQHIKSGFLRKKKQDRKVSDCAVLQSGDSSGRFHYTALPSLFDDVLDELDIDYDTYYCFDLYKPFCTYVVQWLYNRDIQKGTVLLVGPSISPLSIFLKKCGFDVREIALDRKSEPWIDHEDQMLNSDINSLKNLSGVYDIIIGDDILHYTNSPEDILRVLRERLRPEGIFILTAEHAGNGKARLSITRNNIKSVSELDFDETTGSKDKEGKGGLHRGYTAEEAEHLVSGAGFSIHQRRYLIKEKALKGSLFPVFVSSYIKRNILYYVQKAIPFLRGHLFIAAIK